MEKAKKTLKKKPHAVIEAEKLYKSYGGVFPCPKCESRKTVFDYFNNKSGKVTPHQYISQARFKCEHAKKIKKGSKVKGGHCFSLFGKLRLDNSTISYYDFLNLKFSSLCTVLVSLARQLDHQCGTKLCAKLAEEGNMTQLEPSSSNMPPTNMPPTLPNVPNTPYAHNCPEPLPNIPPTNTPPTLPNTSYAHNCPEPLPNIPPPTMLNTPYAHNGPEPFPNIPNIPPMLSQTPERFSFPPYTLPLNTLAPQYAQYDSSCQAQFRHHQCGQPNAICMHFHQKVNVIQVHPSSSYGMASSSNGMAPSSSGMALGHPRGSCCITNIGVKSEPDLATTQTQYGFNSIDTKSYVPDSKADHFADSFLNESCNGVIDNNDISIDHSREKID